MLKYLFTVTYRDGTTYNQNKEDRSITEPDKRSCFFDVRQEDVKTFTLSGNGHTYSVDMDDGHFTIDGVQVELNPENKPPLGNLRLIFWRNRTHLINVTYDTSTGNTTETKEMGLVTRYRFGWQTTINGKNYQEVMQIN